MSSGFCGHVPFSTERERLFATVRVQMAEVIGIVASAITIGASAAQLSLALFSVAQTLKNAPKQIAEIGM